MITLLPLTFLLVSLIFIQSQSFHLLTTSNTRRRRRRRFLFNSSSQDDTSSSSSSSKSLSKSSNHHHHPIGLYIHIPYCRRRCRYCNFSIVPIGTRASTEGEKVVDDVNNNNNNNNNNDNDIDRATRGFLEMDKKYLSYLLRELKQVNKNKNNNNNNKIPLSSIYFGGGTPSLAPVETIASILNAAIGNNNNLDGNNDNDDNDSPFYLIENAEISIEMDPGTFSLEKLQRLRDCCGINRISLGVQSFDDTLLKNIGRVHRKSDVYNAIDMIHTVYGNDANYSIDLITGLPGLTLPKWIETLQEATTLLVPKPTHLSIYDLQIEQGTVFSSWYNNNNNGGGDDGDGDYKNNKSRLNESNKKTVFKLPTDEECAFMYKYTVRTM